MTETGEATYQIALAVPPGTGGVEPDLALSFESGGRSGLVGVGWSLTGLSAVSRLTTSWGGW